MGLDLLDGEAEDPPFTNCNPVVSVPDQDSRRPSWCEQRPSHRDLYDLCTFSTTASLTPKPSNPKIQAWAHASNRAVVSQATLHRRGPPAARPKHNQLKHPTPLHDSAALWQPAKHGSPTDVFGGFANLQADSRAKVAVHSASTRSGGRINFVDWKHYKTSLQGGLSPALGQPWTPHVAAHGFAGPGLELQERFAQLPETSAGCVFPPGRLQKRRLSMGGLNSAKRCKPGQVGSPGSDPDQRGGLLCAQSMRTLGQMCVDELQSWADFIDMDADLQLDDDQLDDDVDQLDQYISLVQQRLHDHEPRARHEGNPGSVSKAAVRSRAAPRDGPLRVESSACCSSQGSNSSKISSAVAADPTARRSRTAFVPTTQAAVVPASFTPQAHPGHTDNSKKNTWMRRIKAINAICELKIFVVAWWC